MPTIGLITEGPTDLLILRLFLNGLCGGDVVVTELLPVANEKGIYPPTGWTKVFDYVGNPEFADAFNRDYPVDFVVIHLDSDSSELFVPPINHVVGEEDRIIDQIKQRLVQEMERVAPEFYAKNAHRILFAIAVHSTECWLLPLFFNDKTRAKVDNCINSLNVKLRRHDIAIDKNQKQVGYRKMLQLDELKARKLKRDKVLEISQYNSGFADFVAQVESRINTPAPDAAKEP